MKHRHKWKLVYTCILPDMCGLLYHCENCDECLEFRKKKPNIKNVIKVYNEVIKDYEKRIRELTI